MWFSRQYSQRNVISHTKCWFLSRRCHALNHHLHIFARVTKSPATSSNMNSETICHLRRVSFNMFKWAAVYCKKRDRWYKNQILPTDYCFMLSILVCIQYSVQREKKLKKKKYINKVHTADASSSCLDCKESSH